MISIASRPVVTAILLCLTLSCSQLLRSSQELVGYNKVVRTGVTLVRNLPPIAEEKSENRSYGLVVVACKAGISWLRNVPEDWRLTVYEKCGPTGAENVTRHITHSKVIPTTNKGAEECNGYLDYILEHYQNDSLTDVTVFMHDDAMVGYTPKRTLLRLPHTPFFSFQELVPALEEHWEESDFWHLGVVELSSAWGAEPHNARFQQEIWPWITKNASIPKRTSFLASAHMAVSRERIQSQPLEVYQQLKTLVSETKGQARAVCCAIERLWHVVFGEPVLLPAARQLTVRLNYTTCRFADDCREGGGNGLEKVKERLVTCLEARGTESVRYHTEGFVAGDTDWTSPLPDYCW